LSGETTACEIVVCVRVCAEVIPVIGGLKSLYHSTCTDNHQTTSSNTNTRPLLLK